MKKIMIQLSIKILIMIFAILLIAGMFLESSPKEVNSLLNERRRKEISIDNLVYESCIKDSYYSDNTKKLITEFLNEYQLENFGLYFEDITNKYTITKNANKVYYGASLIKLLDATYLIRKSMNEGLDLNSTISYETRHIKKYSLKMSQHKIKDQIALRDLIYYAISVSDNTAHEMLFEMIGANNLKNYAKSLGVEISISENDHFGSLTAESANNILKEVYAIISSTSEYSSLLKEAMQNVYGNSLNFNSITFLHKYGEWESTYNDIGIYNSEQPYFISILTPYGYQDYESKVKKISNQIYHIYTSNNEEKRNFCANLQREIYLTIY